MISVVAVKLWSQRSGSRVRVEFLKLKVRSPGQGWGLGCEIKVELSEADVLRSEVQTLRMRVGSGVQDRLKVGLGYHLLPLGHTAPPDMVTRGAGKLPVHSRDEVFLGALEHA